MFPYIRPEERNYGENHRKVLEVLLPTNIFNRMSESQISSALNYEFDPSRTIDELRDYGDICGSVNVQILPEGIITMRILRQREKNNGHSKEDAYKNQQESR